MNMPYSASSSFNHAHAVCILCTICMWIGLCDRFNMKHVLKAFNYANYGKGQANQGLGLMACLRYLYFEMATGDTIAS